MKGLLGSLFVSFFVSLHHHHLFFFFFWGGGEEGVAHARLIMSPSVAGVRGYLFIKVYSAFNVYCHRCACLRTAMRARSHACERIVFAEATFQSFVMYCQP